MGKSLKGKELGKGITQRKNGGYQARFTDDYGKTNYIYDTSLTEIRKKLDNIKYKNEMNTLITNPKMTVSAWYDMYMDIYGSNLRDTTRYQYQKMFNKVKDDIGDYRLKDVNLNIIQRVLNDLSSDAYRKRVRTLLNSIFAKALDNNYIMKNPVVGSVWKIDNSQKQSKDPMTKEQEIFFVNYIYKPRIKQEKIEHVELIEFILQTGLRLGEATGLTWDDIDFENNLIYIRRNLVSTKTKDKDGKVYSRQPRFHEPKTQAGIRKIPMTKRAKEILLYEKVRDENIKSQYEPLDGFNNMVFVSWVNRPIFDDVIRRTLKKFSNEIREEFDSAFPNVSPHILRHTFATRCVEKNMNIKTLQTILGHSNFEITMNIYTHTTDDMLFSEMNKIE